MFYESHLKSEFNFSHKMRRLLWRIVYILFFRLSPLPLSFWRRFLLRSFGAHIGSKILIYPSVEIWAPWNLSIGDRSVIGPNVALYNVDRIEIAEDVTVSQNSHLCTATHNIESRFRELQHAPIVIKKGAWIFADAFLSMGVCIGEGAIVGARSVVAKSVEAQNVVVGNPAVVIKRRQLDWLN